MIKAVIFALSLLLNCALIGHVLSSTCSEEVLWRMSPDSAVKAVVVEFARGATVSPVYEVLLRTEKSLNEGVKVATLINAARNSGSYGVNICWKDKRTLELSYLSARLDDAPKESVIVDGVPIEIIVKSGVYDLSAPPGYMSRALQNHHYFGECQ